MLTDVEQRRLARDVRAISNKSRIPALAGVGCIGLVVVWFCVLSFFALLIRITHAMGHVFGG